MRYPTGRGSDRVSGRMEMVAWIILLVATQQTITNLVRSGRKQR
jgi:hypothetical protein